MSRDGDARTDADTADTIDTAVATDLALSELVETMERVDWSEVPTISTAEAATLTQRFIEARDAVHEQGTVAGGDGQR